MLTLIGLTKIYETKGGRRVAALSDVSLSFPERGLVFVIGKSGSGKSTLLNILGGLDRPTDGQVLLGERDLAALKGGEMDGYRTSCLGFVFQDFQLIEGLSVRENVELALALQGEDESGRIDSLLEEVGLAGYGDRRVSELSGGECQRVAIARSLVKRPKILLADEPTGNLDTRTSAEIMRILKEISRQALVIVVSHNLADAESYADRIVELRDGRVISDKERAAQEGNTLVIDEESITLPYKRPLTDDELLALERVFASPVARKVRQRSDGFVNARQAPPSHDTPTFGRRGLSPAAVLKLAIRFLSRQKLLTLITVLLLSVLLSLFGLVESFVGFDEGEMYKTVLSDERIERLSLYKGTFSKYDGTLLENHVVPIEEDDEEALRALGYTGGIHRLTSFSIPLALTSWELEFGRPCPSENLVSFYPLETYGTLMCDEEYLLRTFGKDGSVPLLAGDLSDRDGIILTDYLADALLCYHKQLGSYRDLVGDLILSNRKRARVVAIIDTDYEELYSEFREDYFAVKKSGDKAAIEELLRSEILADYMLDAAERLGIAYTLNPDFLTDCKDYKEPVRIANATYMMHGVPLLGGNDLSLVPDPSGALKDNEIVLTYSLYNEIFKTNYTAADLATFIPHSITVERYATYATIDSSPILVREFKIVGLKEGTSIASDAVLDDVGGEEVVAFALFLDEPASGDFHSFLEERGYFTAVEDYNVATGVSRIIQVFRDLFLLITAAVLVVAVFMTTLFAAIIISKNRRAVGVLRALGAGERDVTRLFSAMILFVTGATAFLTAFSYYGMISFGNRLLQRTLAELFESEFLMNLSLLTPSLVTLLLNLFVILLVSALSILLGLALLRRLDVIRIIKARE